MDHNYRVS